MTREIKFRAWNVDVKKMTPVNIVDTSEKRIVYLQYTGLKDKNGKEIYEGDIIEVKQPHSKIYNAEIEYIENGFWLRDSDDGKFLPFKDYVEIIGNIYENPDLIK